MHLSGFFYRDSFPDYFSNEIGRILENHGHQSMVRNKFDIEYPKVDLPVMAVEEISHVVAQSDDFIQSGMLNRRRDRIISLWLDYFLLDDDFE